MAVAFVSSVVDKLGDLLSQDSPLYDHQVRREVESLEIDLKQRLYPLKDADSNLELDDYRVETSVRYLTDAAFQLEDAIDTFMLEVAAHRLPSSKNYRYFSTITSFARRPSLKIYSRFSATASSLGWLLPSEIHRYFSTIISLDSFLKETRRIRKEILAQRGIHEITISVLANHGQTRTKGSSGSMTESPSFHGKTEVIGFEEERGIIKQLLDEEKKELCIISIFGMDGIGKTTLAEKVYCSDGIKKHFSVRVLVSVPLQGCRNKEVKLLKRIIRGIMGEKEKDDPYDDSDEKEMLVLELNELLKSLGRYLIVLDDMQTQEAWDEIKTALPDVRNGSRVLLTTSSEEVAISASPFSHTFLRFSRESKNIKQLMESCKPGIFKEIVNYGGKKFLSEYPCLPLAVVVLAGLASKDTYRWPAVLGNQRRSFRGDESYLNIFSLSYKGLPYRLKPCFLLMCSFPQGCEISVKHLIKIWTAAGFIPQEQGNSREETAKDFLRELIERCMVQVVSTSFDGGVRKIRIHNLLRKFCLGEARKVGYFIAESCPEINSSMTTARCLALHDRIDNSLIDTNKGNLKCQKLQTLLGFSLTATVNIGKYLNGLKFVRVIDLEGPLKIGVLPEEITSMKLLIYLRLIDVTKVVLPSSIRKLQNLQTLEVKNGAQLEESLVPSKKILAYLKLLQVLRSISSGSWVKFDLVEMAGLQELEIQDIRDSHKKALLKSLEKMDSLTTLTLRSGESIPTEVFKVFSEKDKLCTLYLEGRLLPRMLPRSNEFPPKLTKLTLEYTKLEEDPMRTLEMLPGLVYLKLCHDAYVGEVMICSKDGFCKLQCVIIDDLTNLKYWEVEDGAMPKLTHFTANRCPALMEFPKGLGELTNLEEIKLLHISHSLKESFQKEVLQKIEGNPTKPSIIINDFYDSLMPFQSESLLSSSSSHLQYDEKDFSRLPSKEDQEGQD